MSEYQQASVAEILRNLTRHMGVDLWSADCERQQQTTKNVILQNDIRHCYGVLSDLSGWFLPSADPNASRIAENEVERGRNDFYREFRQEYEE